MDCLVTKLKGVVNDDTLVKMNELRIKKLAASSWDKLKDSFVIRSKGVANTLSIIGNGYFTDENGTANTGKTKNLNVGEIVTVYVSNGTYEISIANKYAIDVLALNPNLSIQYSGLPAHYEFGDLSAIGYCNDMFVLMLSYVGVKGDIANLKNMTKLQQVYLDSNGEIVGDISAFKNCAKITQLSAYQCDNIYGSISELNGLSILETLSIYESEGITGSTDVFSNLSNLKTVQLWGTGITGGDISVFKNKNNLANLSADDIIFTGDFFDLLASKNFAQCSVGGNFTYTSKTFTGRSYGVVGGIYFTCVNLDDFLNDFQIVSASPLNNVHSITMQGTRTSASDAAISTLQGKGFTVTVPTATDANLISLMSVRSNENFGIAYKDKELIVKPVDLSKMQIYPAKDVSVQKFDTLENAEKFIVSSGLVKSEIK